MKGGWAIIFGFLFNTAAPATDWPEFRGPNRSGTSEAKDVPVAWDATTSIRWKTKLPGPGTSSPILFGPHIYLTCYTGYGLDSKAPGDPKKLKRHLVCLDRVDGTVVWDVPMIPKAPEPGYGGFLALHGYASSTPTVDTDAVYVFNGASGAAAFTHDGKLIWEKDCGTGHHEDWGSASSPVLYKDFVFVHADVESESVFGLDRKTGQEVWKRTFKAEAKNKQHTRSTPLVVHRSGKDELVVHSRMNRVSALDPGTGRTLWEYQGTKEYQNPSPVSNGELVFAMTYLKTVALRRGGEEAWAFRDGSEICTPLYRDGHLFWANEQGMAFCVDAKTGKSVYQERLSPAAGRIYASGVLAGGRIYYVSREKGTYVLAAKPKFELVAHNVIADDPTVFNATPALEDGRIYLRSDRYLYCIGKK